MSVHQKKHLGFNGLVRILSENMKRIENTRQAGKVVYTNHDCAMSAFAMMFFQDPSMLEFQTRLQEKLNLNNLKTLFGVNGVPRATQLRGVIDELPSPDLEKVFTDFFRPLQRGKQLELFRFLGGKYLVTIDGVQYFSSNSIHCPNCPEKNLRTGDTLWHHQAVCAALVHPDNRQVMPIAPEPVMPVDGHSKQDCEINAGKRLIEKIRRAHPKLDIVIAGDSLYSKQPFVDLLREKGMSFVLMAKHGDHKVLFEWVSEFRRMGEMRRLEARDFEGRRYVFEWANKVPLNGTKDADEINYFECTVTKGEKRVYFGSWVTDIPVDANNVSELVRAGRARWKIENENFNTLKNQGYHAEHNFGHGQKNAAYNFFLFILLAFFVHQILELTDPLWQKCRGKFSARKEFWNQLRCTVRILVFESWSHLLEFVRDPPEVCPQL
jgi:hypothetical protein